MGGFFKAAPYGCGFFTSVKVFYSVVYFPFFKIATKFHSKLSKPLNIVLAGPFYFLSGLQSNKKSVREKMCGTYHLVAICKK
jgi:hypothetical protein